ncbi:MAG: hypothetical protein ACI84C_000185 [Flavobacteriales bacterium]|jgi:hypothetical protein
MAVNHYLSIMFRTVSYAIAFTMCLIFFNGCKKDLDEISPRIKFISPYAGSAYSVLEYVDIQVTITDETSIDWVHIDIVKVNNVQIASAQQMSFSGSLSETIQVGILLENIHIETGTYYIRVRAHDGTNEHVSFREIQVYEVPKEVLGIYVFSSINSSTLNIDQVQESGTLTLATWNSDFSFGAANSYHRELAFAGDQLDGTTFIDGSGFDLLHSNLNNNNTSSAYYHDFIFNPEDLRYYAITRDGQIEIYRPGGTLQQTIFTQINQRPYHISVTESRLLVEERSWNGDQQSINQYYKGSGALESSIGLPFALVAILETNDEFQLFGYDGDQFKTMSYSGSSNALGTEIELNTESIGTVQNVIRVDATLNSEAFVLCGDNGMRAFTVNVVQASEVANWSQGGSQVQLNEATGELVVLSGEELITYSWSSSNPIGSVSIGNSALDFAILYNK